MATMQKITSHLWFDRQAEEAVNFYTTVFKNASINKISHYGKEGFETHHMPAGTVMTIDFTLEGQRFIALNGGPVFKFNESVSFMVSCDTQREIDYYWDKLTEGGDKNAQVCGWLKDKFGLSWQVVPAGLPQLLTDENETKSQAVMKVVMQMKKLDIAELQAAFTNA